MGSDFASSSQRRVLLIRNVNLAGVGSDYNRDGGQLYDVLLKDGVVVDVYESVKGVHSEDNDDDDDDDGRHMGRWEVLDCEGKGIMIPSLVHAHIHLDKCFILGQCDELDSGDFSEALRVTAKAKARFVADDKYLRGGGKMVNEDHEGAGLYDRGRRLIEESVECGVTHMRAHVEVDGVVGFGCLEVGIRLKEDMKRVCDVQLCAFAQDPLYDSAEDLSPGENYALLRLALEGGGEDGKERSSGFDLVEVVGSAPYVEPSVDQAKRNITHILDLAYQHSKHADFHLDYNVDPSSEPLIFFVIKELAERIRGGKWVEGKRVTVGHATRLTLFSEELWKELGELMVGLPVALVGLPQSDLYMMGRPAQSEEVATALLPARRYTLDPVDSWKRYQVEVAMAVNNVDNAFTPQGNVDPLGLCTLGVAVFQKATPGDCAILLKSVTTSSRTAIGRGSDSMMGTLFPVIGSPADFVILTKNKSIQSVVLNPSYERTTIKDGRIVAKRVAQRWMDFV